MSHRFHTDFTLISQRIRTDFTTISPRAHNDFTSISHQFHTDFTSSSKQFRNDLASGLTQISQRIYIEFHINIYIDFTTLPHQTHIRGTAIPHKSNFFTARSAKNFFTEHQRAPACTSAHLATEHQRAENFFTEHQRAPA